MARSTRVLNISALSGNRLSAARSTETTRLIVKIVRDPILLDIGLEVLGRLAVIEDARGLAHLAQHGAQRRSAAERVAVRTAMGENEVLVVRAEVCRDFGNGHSCSSSVFSVSFSGFAGFTTRRVAQHL